MEIFYAERLKYRYTSMNRITFLMPFLTVLLAVALTSNFFAVDSYNWWYTGMYPGYLAVMCSIIGGKDKSKKNYTIWSLPCDMEKIWDAKIFTGVVMSGISVIVVVVMTIFIGNVMKMALHVEYIAEPDIFRQLLAGVLMWATSLWEIPVCLFLSQKIGKFLTLIIHVGFYIIMSNFLSLKSFFMLFPGTITARLMCPILGVLPNGLLLQPGSMTYSPELADINNLVIGIPAAILWFGLFWILSRKWFGRQVEK